jgi:hypothetical protein
MYRVTEDILLEVERWLSVSLSTKELHWLIKNFWTNIFHVNRTRRGISLEKPQNELPLLTFIPGLSEFPSSFDVK